MPMDKIDSQHRKIIFFPLFKLERKQQNAGEPCLMQDRKLQSCKQ